MNEMHATQTIDTPPLIVRILAMPANADEGALGCSEVFALLDEYTEMQATGRDTIAYHPLVHRHLQICPGCREEYEALLTMIVMDVAENR